MNDRPIKLTPGWTALFVLFGIIGAMLLVLVVGIATSFKGLLVFLIPGILAFILTVSGFVVIAPNTAKVIQLFGTYKGTATDVGFFWGNPFFTKTAVSQRVQTFETGVQKSAEVKDATGKVLSESQSRRMPAKVNDKDGTPIEVAAVVTFKVTQPAKATFDVDNYEDYVHVQSDAALRTLASQYRYDARDGDEFSLRGHIDEVSAKLKHELQERMTVAGIEVISAQISYLAYAPEIAGAMLQRQQAGAVIAARQLIVEGAVGMVEHALDELAKKQVVQLDPTQKAAMVSNLLVVLCSHSAPQPMLNAGSLHQ